jgi:hypothetical protein
MVGDLMSQRSDLDGPFLAEPAGTPQDSRA